MKSNAVTFILNALLGLCLLASVILCFQSWAVTRSMRQINGRMNSISGYRASVQSLANDCVAYSEKNPAINPILEAYNLKQKSAAPRPAAK